MVIQMMIQPTVLQLLLVLVLLLLLLLLLVLLLQADGLLRRSLTAATFVARLFLSTENFKDNIKINDETWSPK